MAHIGKPFSRRGKADSSCAEVSLVDNPKRPSVSHELRYSTLCIYTVRYEWDEAKNLRNQRKHDGISFELAALIFEDERCLIYPDRLDCETEEQRWHAVGAAQIERQTRAVLLAVHAYREDYHGEEII